MTPRAPITGQIMSVEYLTNRPDGFTRVGIAGYAAAHVVLLGHEAVVTIEGRPGTFQEFMAWIARAGGESMGTFYPDPDRYGAATKVDCFAA